MVTDRDIALACAAEGRDPATRVEELAQGRLPVIDGDRLVGMVSQGDIATRSDDALTARLVEAISSTPANN